jgi:hypothetical protein
VIPSEFGSDLNNSKSAALPVFAHKVEVRKYIEQLAAEGKIEWTAISTGAFLDWGLPSPLPKCEIWDVARIDITKI